MSLIVLWFVSLFLRLTIFASGGSGGVISVAVLLSSSAVLLVVYLTAVFDDVRAGRLLLTNLFVVVGLLMLGAGLLLGSALLGVAGLAIWLVCAIVLIRRLLFTADKPPRDAHLRR